MKCSCEPLVATMVKAKLWPSTPKNARLAFTFDLMNWIEILVLECHVALKDICKALVYNCPHLIVKVIII